MLWPPLEHHLSVPMCIAVCCVSVSRWRWWAGGSTPVMGDDIRGPGAMTGQRLPHSVRESLAHPPPPTCCWFWKKRQNILRNLSFNRQQLEVFGWVFFFFGLQLYSTHCQRSLSHPIFVNPAFFFGRIMADRVIHWAFMLLFGGRLSAVPRTLQTSAYLLMPVFFLRAL